MNLSKIMINYKLRVYQYILPMFVTVGPSLKQRTTYLLNVDKVCASVYVTNVLDFVQLLKG